MSIKFKVGNADGRTVFYYPVHVTDLYMTMARDSAIIVSQLGDLAETRHVLTALIFSVMALEAGANEASDGVIPDELAEDFQWCRGAVRQGRPGGMTATTWKWRYLLRLKGWGGDVDDPVLREVEAAVQARNQLVHFQPLKHALQIRYHEDILNPIARDGRLSLAPPADRPHEVEPGVAARHISAHTACAAYMAARDLLLLWPRVCGQQPDDPPGIPPVEVPPAREHPTSVTDFQ